MVMSLVAKPKSADLSFTAGGDNPCSELRIYCSPSFLDRGVWEIGNRHVFAHRANRPIFSKRRSCGLVVCVHRKSEVAPEFIDGMGLSDSKIGALVFIPPGEKILFWFSQPAILQANVFVNDEFFDRLVFALQSGKRTTRLELEIQKQGVLEFGWEPDGSRRVWKLESTTETSCVDVESMDFGLTF
jgi:hypothetical protein